MFKYKLFFLAFILAMSGQNCKKDDTDDKNSVTEPETTMVDSAQSHLKYFGFMRVDGESDYSSDVTGYSNTAEKTIESYTEDLSFDLTFYNEFCIKPILNIQNIFFEETGGQAPGGVDYGLKKDYRLHWEYFVKTNRSDLDSQHITALYLAEEPLYKGISNDELASVCTLIKEDLPYTPVLIIASYATLDTFAFPGNVDYLGFKRFGVADPNTDAAYQADMGKLKSKLGSGQRLFIVMDAQWTPAHANAGIDSTDMHTVVENYYKLANSEEKAIGLLGYLWPNAYDDAQQVGTSGLPQGAKETAEAIGAAIMVNFNPCED